MSSIMLTEDQCTYIANALRSHFYVRTIKEDGEYVWKKPTFITIREIFEIISNAIEESYNDNRDGYTG